MFLRNSTTARRVTVAIWWKALSVYHTHLPYLNSVVNLATNISYTQANCSGLGVAAGSLSQSTQSVANWVWCLIINAKCARDLTVVISVY